MNREDLFSRVLEFCDESIPELEKLEGTALVLSVYLRQARTVARQLRDTAKLAREKGAALPSETTLAPRIV